MTLDQYISKFQNYKKNQALIEGVQALKHAVRFDAEIESIITCDINTLRLLINQLAPDISQMISSKIIEVNEATFKHVSPKNHRTKVVSLAKRVNYHLEDVAKDKPIVFLEDPKDLENIGAVIRVAAAADAAAVATDALVSIWHPGVIRGAAGLHYALPVMNSSLDQIKTAFPRRKVVSLDPNGKPFKQYAPKDNSILVFGTERSGVREETLKNSDLVLRLPMKEGVSSLNLATSVAATLYQMV